MKKADKKAPYHGLTFHQFMAKRHPEVRLIEHLSSVDTVFTLITECWDAAGGLVTDNSCKKLCSRFKSCEGAAKMQALGQQIFDQGPDNLEWCGVCGCVFPKGRSNDDNVRRNPELCEGCQ